MKKIKELLNNKEIKRNVILVVLVALILISLGVLLFSMISKSKKITDLEKIKITEISNDVMTYMEEIENNNSKKIDKYICYALVYSYNELDKNELMLKELNKLINNIFNVKITEEDILNLGITPLMVEKNITYDPADEKYILNVVKKSLTDIASEEIIKYELTDIKKQKRNTYEATYEKYVVKKPYEILNYYIENNKDTEEITKYLKGEKEKKNIKKYITKDNISKIGKKESEVSITYIIKDNKILIDNIS